MSNGKPIWPHKLFLETANQVAQAAFNETWYIYIHTHTHTHTYTHKEMEGKPRGPKRYRNQYYDVTLFGYKHDFFFFKLQENKKKCKYWLYL